MQSTCSERQSPTRQAEWPVVIRSRGRPRRDRRRVAGRHREPSARPSTPTATNFAVWAPRRRRGRGSACSTTTARETRVELREHTLGVWHGYVRGRRPGPALRLPRRTAVGPRRGGIVFNPAKLLLDPYARADRRRARRTIRRLRPSTGRTAATTATPRRTSRVGRGRRRRLRLGRRSPRRDRRGSDTVIYEAARRGLHQAAPRRARGAARHLRRARAPGGDRLPRGARRHRGRAAAGAPLRHRAAASPSAA